MNNREMPDMNVQYLIAVMPTDKIVLFHVAHDKARVDGPGILRERVKIELVADN